MIRVGRVVAALLLGSLGVAVVVMNLATTGDPVGLPSTSVNAVAPVVSEKISTAPPDTAPPDTVPVATATTAKAAAPARPLAVVVHGLEAWGRFAVDGDLEPVSEWFDRTGPQFERFRTEAKQGGVGGDPYVVMLRGATATVSGNTAEVSGRVVFARTGEPSQVFDWDFRLTRHHDSWMIWNVSPAAP